MLEVTLAVDLRQEFYPEFGALLACLVQLLRPTEVEQLEDVFSTLCYLFNTSSASCSPTSPPPSPRTARSSPATAHVREFAAGRSPTCAPCRPTLPRALRSAVLSHVGAGSRRSTRGSRSSSSRGARRRAPTHGARPPPALLRAARRGVRRDAARDAALRGVLCAAAAHMAEHAPRSRR